LTVRIPVTGVGHEPPCDKLARATRGMYQSIEEVAAKRLTEFAAAWDAVKDTRARLDAIVSLISDCFHKRAKQDDEQLPPEQEQVIEHMKSAARNLGGTEGAEAAREFMRLARRHPRWRIFRGELWRDAERALGELAASRVESLGETVLRVRQRMSTSGRSLQRRTISTPLLLKGLEFDHVLIPDAAHFGQEQYAQAKLFYVAISRATQSLTITAPDRYLQFQRPNL
jgi:superfamily I DNA/RNA helicase